MTIDSEVFKFLGILKEKDGKIKWVRKIGELDIDESALVMNFAKDQGYIAMNDEILWITNKGEIRLYNEENKPDGEIIA